MIIFTYGTLQPDGNRYELIAPDVIDITAATFEGRLIVMPEGIPIAVEGDNPYPIEGTLLYLDDNPAVVDKFDKIVGVKNPRSPFMRVNRRVISDRGDTMAGVYICKTDEIDRVLAEGSELSEGDWRLWESGD